MRKHDIAKSMLSLNPFRSPRPSRRRGHLSTTFSLLRKKFPNGLRPKISQRERAALRTRKVGIQVEAERMKDGADDLFGLDGLLSGIRSDLVTLSNRTSALYAASGKRDRPALRPMIAPAGGIDLRRTAEFRE